MECKGKGSEAIFQVAFQKKERHHHLNGINFCTTSIFGSLYLCKMIVAFARFFFDALLSASVFVCCLGCLFDMAITLDIAVISNTCDIIKR